MSEVKQFKLSSGQEVVAEVVEWDTPEDAALICRNVLEIHFINTNPMVRVCTMRPFMLGQIEHGTFQAFNSEMILAQAVPTEEVLGNYYDTLKEYLKDDAELEEQNLDEMFAEIDEEAEDNIIQFMSTKKDTLH